jgi:hypothetical protein
VKLRAALAALFAAGIECARCADAGPPYQTDDPEPTSYRNWEIYTGGTYQNGGSGKVSLALPFAEFNYGAMPNVQVSISLPLAYDSAGAHGSYGYGDTEFGIKTRFVQESGGSPQVSFYPSVEIPSGAGSVRTFLPIWAQKSWGSWTAFGGGGFELNAGTGRHDSTFVGGALERDVSAGTTIGAELYSTSSQTPRAPGSTAFDVGMISSLGNLHAILFSAGRTLGGQGYVQCYAAYEFKLGPRGKAR